ncbi:hypothetical protein L6164_035225 [Bauhinia variegata]|uniref:Uncharacterized protein n=1 Tax=Bauhinia variegata TaxID=167791 RepID=A0ACB9KY97_BAUVA|nr:hypothetical protein L6164_035225 [Bauhinia variegata]
MADSVESLISISELVSTASTKKRVRIFGGEVPAILSNSDMSTELPTSLKLFNGQSQCVYPRFGISCLKKYRIVILLHEGLADRNSAKSREGAFLGFECLPIDKGYFHMHYVYMVSDINSATNVATHCDLK